MFKGQWIICGLKKELAAPLRLRERYVGVIAMKSDVETEHVAFNEKYQILTSDPHTAFCILTPHFMEYIINVDKQADAQTYFKFAGNEVHIALFNRRDLFEVNAKEILGGKSVAEIRERIREDVKYITDVIDELLINDYLF